MRMYVPTPKSRILRTSSAIFTGDLRLLCLTAPPAIERETLRERLHALAHCRDRFVGSRIPNHFRAAGSHFLHFALFETAGGDGGAAETDPAGVQRRIGVERNGVLVHGDAGGIERIFRLAAFHALQ